MNLLDIYEDDMVNVRAKMLLYAPHLFSVLSGKKKKA